MNAPAFEEYVEYCNEPALSVCDTPHAVEYDDFCRLLDSIKRSLPETQQRVYEYSRLRQQSNKEIAEALNLSEQTVKNQLSLALKSFKEKLRNYNLVYLLIGLFNG